MTGSSSVVALAFTAFVLLWAFGAYNRLMRARAQVIRAFGNVGHAIEERAAVLLAVSHAQLIHATEPQAQALWIRLEACVQQAATAMAHADAKPLQTERLAALGAALAALDDVLLSAQQHPQALRSAPWPMEIQHQLARCDARLLTQTEGYDAAVAAYNVATVQFPTLLVAKLFGMQLAQTLGQPAAAPALSTPVDENTLLTKSQQD